MAAANRQESDPDPSLCRLILIEDIPGSGKSSTAQWICRRLNERGIRTQWFLEERHDHPVIDRPTCKPSRQPDYADRCIARWQAFSASIMQNPDPAFQILEGTLFQSTVRPLLEHDHPAAERERYLKGMQQAVQPLNPQLVQLVQPDPLAYLRGQLVSRKGAQIVDKIAAYTQTTACARRHGWRGREEMFAFCAHYRAICDELIASSDFPLLRFDTSTGDWDGLHAALSPWLDKLAANRNITPRPWQHHT